MPRSISTTVMSLLFAAALRPAMAATKADCERWLTAEDVAAVYRLPLEPLSVRNLMGTCMYDTKRVQTIVITHDPLIGSWDEKKKVLAEAQAINGQKMTAVSGLGSDALGLNDKQISFLSPDGKAAMSLTVASIVTGVPAKDQRPDAEVRNELTQRVVKNAGGPGSKGRKGKRP